MKKLLLQAASNGYEEMLRISQDIHAEYCKKHGITFLPVYGRIHAKELENRRSNWDKIFLTRVFFDFDVIVWMDADTLVVNMEDDITQVVENEQDIIAMCRHTIAYKGSKDHYNSGVYVVKTGERTKVFFDKVLSWEPIEHLWQEQIAILELINSGEFPGLDKIMDNRYNMTMNANRCDNPTVCAWHGYGKRAIDFMKEKKEEVYASKG